MIPKKYEHISFKPPESVASAAAKGLRYRERAGGKGGLSTSQAKAEGVGSGVQRAVNLKNRDTLSPNTVKRMKSFFDRHQKNKSIDPEHKNEPWKDRGYVAHLLWGGDPGYAWSKKVVKQMEDADNKKTAAQRVVIAYLKMAEKDFDPDQLKKGIEVEKEHGDIYQKAKKWLEDAGKDMPVSEEHFYELIAKAHLREMPDYYDRLEIMEKGIHKESMEFSGISSLLHPGKNLTDREVARAIRLSIAAEHDAVHLYELLVDCIKNKNAKKILQDIANEEKVHIGEFQRLLKYFDEKDENFLEEGINEAEELINKK